MSEMKGSSLHWMKDHHYQHSDINKYCKQLYTNGTDVFEVLVKYTNSL